MLVAGDTGGQERHAAAEAAVVVGVLGGSIHGGGISGTYNLHQQRPWR
jgi:hypothetical protein